MSRVPSSRPAGPPDVLLIMVDDLGLDLAVYGRQRVPTPVIDSLAAEGLVFTRAYAADGVCCPARSAVYTGLLPHENGMYGFMTDVRLHDDVETFDAILHRRGYFVAAAGKLHVSPLDRFRWDAPYRRLKRGDADGTRRIALELFAAARRSGRPFFVMINPLDPHLGSLDEEVARKSGTRFSPEAVTFDPDGLDYPQHRLQLAEYYDGIARADRVIGAILAALDDAGLAETTLVFLTSDHGSPEVIAKRTLYDKGVRVPLIARWPGRVPAGRRTGALVGNFDILATVLDLAGRPEPGLYSRSFAGVLREPDTAPGRTSLVLTHTLSRRATYYPIRGLVSGNWKYLRNLRRDLRTWLQYQQDLQRAIPRLPPERRRLALRRMQPPHEELYDLASDPFELHDLAQDPKFRGVLERLRTELRATLERTDDPLLFLWDHRPGMADPFGERYRERRGGWTSPRKTKKRPAAPNGR